MKISYRKAVPYVVMCRWVTRHEIPQQLPQLIGEVYRWLTKKNIEPAGAPFFEYRVMQGERFHVCVGFPVTSAVDGDEQVHAGAFPEGEYAGTRHVGAYDGLYKANQQLNEWFAAEGYQQRFPGEQRFGSQRQSDGVLFVRSVKRTGSGKMANGY